MNQFKRSMKAIAKQIIFTTILTLCAPVTAGAQSVVKELKEDVNRAAGMFYARPIIEHHKVTPPPKGKKPFYINNYCCPASYYLDKVEYYKDTYDTFAKADTLGKLTELGKDVFHRIGLLCREVNNRGGEITPKGAMQSRGLMKQMLMRVPGMLSHDTYYSVHSVVENHCIMTMQEGLLQLSSMLQPITARSRASDKGIRYMAPHDEELAAQATDSLTMARYNRFAALNTNDGRLMRSLFNDMNYVVTNIDEALLARQLFILAGNYQHTDLAGQVTLWDIFTPEEIHQHWRKQNAWHYINYGGCTLNGGYQAYTRRAVLRNMIHMGDSIINHTTPLMHLRYTYENVVMSLACLMELDGVGIHTANLDSLEDYGWANYRIAPLGGAITMVHYRSEIGDPDVLVKVLFNGHEAKLPIETDCFPYYHWQEVKRYYLRKLYRYENKRLNNKISSR